MKRYLSNWNFMRVLRLALGIMIIVQGVRANDWSFIILGVLFSAMPVFNIGCCGGGSCSIPNRNNTCTTKESIQQDVK